MYSFCWSISSEIEKKRDSSVGTYHLIPVVVVVVVVLEAVAVL